MSKIPPSYGDLGKNARDLFNKGFSKYKVALNVRVFNEVISLHQKH